MQDAVNIFINLLKNAWVVLVSFILVMAACGVLYRILSVTGASLLGAKQIVAESVGAVATIVGLTLLAFFGIPALVKGSIEAVKGSSGVVCSNQIDSPLIELATLLVQLLIAFGGIRLILAFAKAIASTAVGMSGQMANAFIEAGGVLMVSFLASVVVPVAATFLGACHKIPIPNFIVPIPTPTPTPVLPIPF
jgi:hypothetical protein